MVANVLASMPFGGLTGSALADVAALGPIELNKGMIRSLVQQLLLLQHSREQ